MQELEFFDSGGAEVIGPVLMGMAKPVNVLEQGASVQECRESSRDDGGAGAGGAEVLSRELLRRVTASR